jgi:hypothetical protein
MTNEILEGMKHNGPVPRITFYASERAAAETRDERLLAEIRAAQNTRGYVVTANREANGIRQFEKGDYKSQWTDGGKVAEFNKPVVSMTIDEVRAFR